MNTSTFTSDELKVTKYFLKQLKNNNVPTYHDLYKYIKKRKINFGNSKSTKKILRKIKNNIEAPALFNTIKPVTAYQTINIDDLGLLSADYSEYKKKTANSNKGYIGFFMVVSVAAKKRWGVLMKSKSMPEFENAMEEICLGNIFPVITTVLSDRESAIFSARFQKKMKDKYNITFHFIHRLNKAWSAENAIRHTQEDISIVLHNNNTERWIDVLPHVIATHNRKKIDNTSYSPNEIDDSNFHDFLNQRDKTDDITMNYNTNSISLKTLPKGEKRNKALKFDIGDKVLASFQSLYGRKAFSKPSVEGSYSKKQYIIKNGYFKRTKDDKFVPGKNYLIIFYILYIYI